VIRQRTSVGMDVHARSVFCCALDGETGEIVERQMTPNHDEIIGWTQSLPGPVRVVYEAGPTGFGLARSLATAGIDCDSIRSATCEVLPHAPQQRDTQTP
jgi:transposase